LNKRRKAKKKMKFKEKMPKRADLEQKSISCHFLPNPATCGRIFPFVPYMVTFLP
jgi:hypothetical protein